MRDLDILITLCQLTENVLSAMAREEWESALWQLNERQPIIDQLEAAVIADPGWRQQPEWLQWQSLENQLGDSMARLSQKKVQLEQVFLQIQTSKQRLKLYQALPVPTREPMTDRQA